MCSEEWTQLIYVSKNALAVSGRKGKGRDSIQEKVGGESQRVWLDSWIGGCCKEYNALVNKNTVSRTSLSVSVSVSLSLYLCLYLCLSLCLSVCLSVSTPPPPPPALCVCVCV